uniref:Polygalacturonase n=1 Tax=Mangifera indica TaxID=29780 RepID=A0A514YDE3_MANIN|nr:polygalacturonase [Mangifera indica]
MTDLSKYSFGAGWVDCRWMEGLRLAGGRSLNGQGAKAWPYNQCHPIASIVNFKFYGYLMRLHEVQTSSQTRLKADVNHQQTVRTLKESTLNEPLVSIFQGHVLVLVMIVPLLDKEIPRSLSVASLVDQEDTRMKYAYLKNIWGTSSSAVAVAFERSKRMPCQNINLGNVHIELSGEKQPTFSCKNVEATYFGTQFPPPCNSSLTHRRKLFIEKILILRNVYKPYSILHLQAREEEGLHRLHLKLGIEDTATFFPFLLSHHSISSN